MDKNFRMDKKNFFFNFLNFNKFFLPFFKKTNYHQIFYLDVQLIN